MSLIEKTLYGTFNKVEIAIQRIKAFEPPEGYFLAYSGGKDSTVILELAKRAGVKFDAHYNVTTIDPRDDGDYYDFVENIKGFETHSKILFDLEKSR